jgi:hypothetical protein
MKKLIIFIVGLAFVVSVGGASFGRTLAEEKTAVQSFLKLLDAKINKAKKANQFAKVTSLRAQKAATLAHWASLNTPAVVAPVAPPVAPVLPPAPVVVKPAPTRLFGWGIDTTLDAKFISDAKQSTIFGIPTSGVSSGIMGHVVLDPSGMFGISGDAVKLKIGTGLYYVYGTDGLKAIPLYAGGIIHLPQWLGGQDSYLTGGLNYVVYGNERTSGNIGGDIYFGITADFGIGLGKTGFEFGYNVVRSKTSKGLSISISQPLAL